MDKAEAMLGVEVDYLINKEGERTSRPRHMKLKVVRELTAIAEAEDLADEDD
jgi:hypothetical protein